MKAAPTWMLCAAALLAACRPAPPGSATPATPAAPVAVPAAAEAGFVLVQELPASAPGGTALRLRVLGAESPQASGVLRVRAIEVLQGAQVLQRIEGLDTQTPLAEGQAPLEVPDMNFDGHPDLRLVESRPAGPNTPYLNWLWNPSAQRFEASPALDEITAPRFDGERRQVQSDWREGAGRYGTDTYAWGEAAQAGRLLPLRREERVYSAPGRYRLTVYRWAGSGWQRVSSQPGRDG